MPPLSRVRVVDYALTQYDVKMVSPLSKKKNHLRKEEWKKVRRYHCWSGKKRKKNKEMYMEEEKFAYFPTLF